MLSEDLDEPKEPLAKSDDNGHMVPVVNLQLSIWTKRPYYD